MFFFGSLSTFFPYLIYISVVWICVLIGVRGQFFSGLLSLNQEQKEVTTESKSTFTDNDCFVPEIFASERNTSKDKSIVEEELYYFFFLVFYKSVNYTIPDRIVTEMRISGHFLRAPPSHIS